MPERRFDDGYWDDPFVQLLSKDGKILYAYLFTNKHCTPAGLYQITPSTIAFETKLGEADIPQLFTELIKKVVWYPEENLVWVKNFIKRQSISSKFLVAVARSLTTINNNGAIKALIDYNRERYTLLIPYEYPINRVSIPSTTTTTSPSPSNSNKEDRVVKGKKERDEELAAISKLYEENVGQLGPVVAEKLKMIATDYPPGWFKEALAEAIEAGVRKLNYIEAILERWQAEGFKAPKRKEGGHSEKGQRVKGSRPASDFRGKW